MKEFFPKTVNGIQPLTIFTKNLHRIDLCYVSKCHFEPQFSIFFITIQLTIQHFLAQRSMLSTFIIQGKRQLTYSGEIDKNEIIKHIMKRQVLVMYLSFRTVSFVLFLMKRLLHLLYYLLIQENDKGKLSEATVHRCSSKQVFLSQGYIVQFTPHLLHILYVKFTPHIFLQEYRSLISDFKNSYYKGLALIQLSFSAHFLFIFGGSFNLHLFPYTFL